MEASGKGEVMKLIAFLGNPGREYRRTRHNAGFLIADHLYPSASWQKKFHGEYALENGMKLLKPQTYMNLSGVSVGEAASFFRLKPQEILVVHDDLELPFGVVRLQLGGGLQGHNGLRSIKERLGSDQFARLRFGIGRPQHGGVAPYVLMPFSKDEEIGWTLLLPHIRTMVEQCDTIPQVYKLP